jgi:hypothetical protein
VSLVGSVEEQKKSQNGYYRIRTVNSQRNQGDRGLLRRLDAAWSKGLPGAVAGKMKFRDQLVISGLAVLVGIGIFKSEGILLAIVAVVAINVGCGLLIRLWKWRVGVPRSSSDY